jgi:hypothetical protein
MRDWHADLLGRCAELEGAAVGEGAFGPGTAVWVGKREVAHFDTEEVLDIRLTKSLIRSRRSDLRDDERIRLRRGTSDWLEFRVRDQSDVDDALSLIRDAVRANLPTAPPGNPPTGDKLSRRRRFH